MVALWRSTRMRKASRSPASVRSMAMASAARTLSTLSFIRILRQVFSLAVRSAKPLLAQFALNLNAARPAVPTAWCAKRRKSRGGLKYRIITVDSRAEPRCGGQHQELKVDSTIHPRANGRDLARCQQIRQVARGGVGRHRNARGSRRCA